MINVFSKTVLIAALAGMALTPVAASAQTRAATSPVFNNAGNLMQGERSDEELRSAGRMRDGRVWSDEARAWVDSDGRRWLLDDGKWYPIRGRLLPVLFLSAIAALAIVAATSDNQSPGAN